jgi:hypothetical protein
MSYPVNLIVEGRTDELIVKRLLQQIGVDEITVLGQTGKSYITPRIGNWNHAAQFAHYLVVIDLDRDAKCAPQYVKALLPNPSQGMLLRIAVRAIEAWLLADSAHLAKFLGVNVENFPTDPDAEANPKETLLRLVKRSNRKKLKSDMLTSIPGKLAQGPGYSTQIAEFLYHPAHPWRPEVAAQHSDSLRRCIAALQRWPTVTLAP